jgi:hypothetical protein
MIRLKGTGEVVFTLKKSGSAASANNIDNLVAPFAGHIAAVYASFGVMGTDGTGAPTQDVIADIKKNGTSIFSGATKLNWTHASQAGTANTSIAADNIGALTNNPTAVKKGDFLRLDITQILNGTSPTQPTDLTVVIVLTRGFRSQPSKMLAGQVTDQD